MIALSVAFFIVCASGVGDEPLAAHQIRAWIALGISIIFNIVFDICRAIRSLKTKP